MANVEGRCKFVPNKGHGYGSGEFVMDAALELDPHFASLTDKPPKLEVTFSGP